MKPDERQRILDVLTSNGFEPDDFMRDRGSVQMQRGDIVIEVCWDRSAKVSKITKRYHDPDGREGGRHYETLHLEPGWSGGRRWPERLARRLLNIAPAAPAKPERVYSDDDRVPA